MLEMKTIDLDLQIKHKHTKEAYHVPETVFVSLKTYTHSNKWIGLVGWVFLLFLSKDCMKISVSLYYIKKLNLHSSKANNVFVYVLGLDQWCIKSTTPLPLRHFCNLAYTDLWTLKTTNREITLLNFSLYFQPWAMKWITLCNPTSELSGACFRHMEHSPAVMQSGRIIKHTSTQSHSHANIQQISRNSSSV